MNFASIFAICAFAALLPPIAIAFAFRNVGYSRRKHLRKLLNVFPRLASTSAGEYAAYKYELFDAPTVHPGPPRFTKLADLLGPLIFGLTTSLCFFAAALLTTNPDLFTKINPFLGGFRMVPNEAQGDYQQATAKFYTLVFAVSYLWIILSLLKKAQAYTLTPLYFLEGSLEIIIALLIAYVVRPLIPSIGIQHLWLTATAIAIGLYRPIGSSLYRLIGSVYWPFLISLLRGRWQQLSQPGIPLSAIPGLDGNALSALSAHGIRDATSLATANPVLLFVETPFGMYELLDWLAQAQLLSAVGVRRFVHLGEVGCRTIFDLIWIEERERRPPISAESRYFVVQRILAPEFSGHQAPSDENLPAANVSELYFHDFVSSIKATPHVQRLIHLRRNMEQVPPARAASDGPEVLLPFAENLERRLAATITQALTGPTLTRYSGWVQTKLDRSGQSNGVISASARFFEQQPDWGTRAQISIRDGDKAEWVEFDLELRIGHDRDNTVKKTVSVPASGNSTEYVLTAEYDFSAKPPIWLHVFQRNRLLQTIRLTEIEDAAEDSTESPFAVGPRQPEAPA